MFDGCCRVSRYVAERSGFIIVDAFLHSPALPAHVQRRCHDGCVCQQLIPLGLVVVAVSHGMPTFLPETHVLLRPEAGISTCRCGCDGSAGRSKRLCEAVVSIQQAAKTSSTSSSGVTALLKHSSGLTVNGCRSVPASICFMFGCSTGRCCSASLWGVLRAL